MSVYMGITLTVAQGFEEKGGWYWRRGGVDVHIQQNKLRVGIKETKWVVGGTLMNITSLDLSVFAGRL